MLLPGGLGPAQHRYASTWRIRDSPTQVRFYLEHRGQLRAEFFASGRIRAPRTGKFATWMIMAWSVLGSLLPGVWASLPRGTFYL